MKGATDKMTWDEQVASRTLWGECRGEPEEGQRAVAHVLWNRMRDGRWGKSLAAVCLARLQFSCWNPSDEQRPLMAVLSDSNPMLQKLAGILAGAEKGTDPTGGALFYYSDSMIVPPKWAQGMTFLRKIGHHSFYTDKK
jgi:N-acetylmuramoyl-L-alanine amidase